jgi:hypothetical protein
MFNRKITAESFDESLDDFEDFLQDPLSTKDLSNKSITNDISSVDLETGEILKSPSRTPSAHQQQKELGSSSKPFSKAQMSQKESLNPLLTFTIPIGVSFFLGLMLFLLSYWLYSTEFSKISVSLVQLNSKVSVLEQSISHLQTSSSAKDETEVFFNEIEDLSTHLEKIEIALETHLQSAQKRGNSGLIQKVSPTDLLKNVSYLGFFGSTNHPTALISIKDEKKELTTGQFLIESWQVIAIYPHQITLSHPNGMIQNISTKKPLF